MRKIYPARLPRAAYDETRSVADIQRAYGSPNWDNLRENLCPKCSRDLANAKTEWLGVPLKKYLTHKCGFRVLEQKMNKIITTKVNQGLEDAKDEYENY